MQSKVCPECQNELSATEFRPNHTRSDGLQTYCIKCDKERQRQYYKENKEKTLERNKQAKQMIREFIDSYKTQTPCADCKNQYHPFVMDFDHLRDKQFDISTMVRRRLSLARIREEMAKCELVCANCHRMRTLTRTQGVKAACKAV